jgi:NTP pyrophosphatase (non-canonical NTP hydrolase)
MSNRTEEISVIGIAACHEALRARQLHPPFNSVHEGYAVLLEEMDELWEEIKKRKAVRNYDKIHREALQVAAMAMCLINECPGRLP